VKMPIRLQIASAVFLLSPVIMITRIPALRQVTMAGLTSILGGSNMPTTPTKVRSTSYSTNLLAFTRSMVLGLTGLSLVARARQRRVSRPVPYSIARSMIFCLILSVIGFFSAPIRIWVQRSRTPSFKTASALGTGIGVYLLGEGDESGLSGFSDLLELVLELVEVNGGVVAHDRNG